MQITHYRFGLPSTIDVQTIVDDFGNETRMLDWGKFSTTARAFTNAKLFVYGLTFEEMELRTIYPVYEAH